MGGSNSGGHNWKGRLTVEEVPSLHIQSLLKAGALQFRVEGKLDFKNGEAFPFAVSESGLVTVEFPCAVQHFNCTLEPRHFGGRQAYFVCPRCRSLRTSLYIRSQFFLCRRCLRLKYRSQRSRAGDRALNRGRKAQTDLGWSNAQIGDIPPRPKYMRRNTYQKLIDRIEAAERVHDELFLSSARRFMSRL